MALVAHRKIVWGDLEHAGAAVTAKLLVDQHGEDALIHAAIKADELMAAVDRDGQMTWVRVLGVVDELSAVEWSEGAKLH